jgi:hypothetical protein
MDSVTRGARHQTADQTALPWWDREFWNFGQSLNPGRGVGG